MTDFTITDACGPEDIAHVRALLSENADSIGAGLSLEDIASETRRLPGLYAPPRGALLLARDCDSGAVLGCVGLRPLPGPGDCELRRLFVRPAARGRAIGRELGQAGAVRARQMGYRRVLVETHESLTWATRIYEEVGYRPIPPYYANPQPGTFFMARDLTGPED